MASIAPGTDHAFYGKWRAASVWHSTARKKLGKFGHAKPAITAATYTHAASDAEHKATKIGDSLLAAVARADVVQAGAHEGHN